MIAGLTKLFAPLLQPQFSISSVSPSFRPVAPVQAIHLFIGSLTFSPTILYLNIFLLLQLFNAVNSYNTQSKSSLGLLGVIVKVSEPAVWIVHLYQVDCSSITGALPPKLSVQNASLILSRTAPRSLTELTVNGLSSHKMTAD